MLLKNEKKIIIGYDLANTCSQISYCYKKEESDIETLSTVEGEENYDIPTVLCKRAGTNQWLFGHAAHRFYEEHPEEGILVDNLLKLALDGEIVQIDGRGYHPAALLALFIKRSLSTVLKRAGVEKIAMICFATEQIDQRMEALIRRMIKTLELKSTVVSCRNYEECFFSYLSHQPRDLWKNGALLLDYRGNDLVAVSVESNVSTIPKVMYSTKRRYPFAGTDRELLEIAGELCQGKSLSSVYLIGEKFSGDWMEESLKYLCIGRRVFQGNNLYSKGACYSVLQESLKSAGEEEEYLFLGPDKLKANVGMKVCKRGEEVYNALLDAGMCWKGMEEIFEFYLKGENDLELLITPLVNVAPLRVHMELEGLKLEKEDVTRIRMKLSMPKENILQIAVNDLGFGEFREAYDGKWIKEVAV